MTYTFALNINDETQTFSPKNGLDISDLSDLTGHLKKAIAARKDSKCVLSGVENHGYTPNFSTESEYAYTRFVSIHKDIQEKSINDLNKDEAVYANTLKKILSTDKYIEALDNNRLPVVRLTSKDIDSVASNYSVITNKTGIVSEIGSPKLEDNRHIYLHNVDYKIFITPAQEQILKEHYRNGTVELKLKQRRSIKTGRILNAILLKITLRPSISFAQSISELSQEELNSFGDINNVEDIITLIRS